MASSHVRHALRNLKSTFVDSWYFGDEECHELIARAWMEGFEKL